MMGLGFCCGGLTSATTGRTQCRTASPTTKMVTLASRGNLTVVSSVVWGYERGALQEGLHLLHNHLLVAEVQMQAPALSDQLHGGVAPVRLERARAPWVMMVLLAQSTRTLQPVRSLAHHSP